MLWINLDIVWSAWSKDIQLYHRKGLWWWGGCCWRVKRSLRHLQQRYKYICTNAMNNVITHIYIQVISFHSVHGRLRHLNNHQDRSGCSVNYFEICLEFRVFLHIISNTSSTHINKSSTQWNTTPPPKYLITRNNLRQRKVEDYPVWALYEIKKFGDFESIYVHL